MGPVGPVTGATPVTSMPVKGGGMVSLASGGRVDGPAVGTVVVVIGLLVPAPGPAPVPASLGMVLGSSLPSGPLGMERAPQATSSAPSAGNTTTPRRVMAEA